MGKHEQNMSCCCCLFLRVCGLDIPDLLAYCIDVFVGIAFVRICFKRVGGMDFPSFVNILSMKVCGLDIPDLCVVLIVLESDS